MNSRIRTGGNNESEIERDVREAVPARRLEHHSSPVRVDETIALRLARAGQHGEPLSPLDLEGESQSMQLARQAGGVPRIDT